MRVLIACEYTGAVRDAFTEAGHDARSCDILPSESARGFHYQEDVIRLLCRIGHGFDLMVAHPPCTYLSSSGLHWNKRLAGRAEKTEEALLFVQSLMAAPIGKICIENPDGCIGTRLRPQERGFIRQRIQPYMFGEDASKWTVLWLKGVEPLDIPPREQWHPGRMVEGVGEAGATVEQSDRQRAESPWPVGDARLGSSQDIPEHRASDGGKVGRTGAIPAGRLIY